MQGLSGVLSIEHLAPPVRSEWRPLEAGCEWDTSRTTLETIPRDTSSTRCLLSTPRRMPSTSRCLAQKVAPRLTCGFVPSATAGSSVFQTCAGLIAICTNGLR